MTSGWFSLSKWERPDADESGYAAVDALVALMILGSTIICAVSATVGSWRAAAGALELRRANSISVYLQTTAQPDPGVTSGEIDGFAWRREVSEPVPTLGAGAVCERTVALRALRTGRTFVTKANTVCQIDLGP